MTAVPEYVVRPSTGVKVSRVYTSTGETPTPESDQVVFARQEILNSAWCYANYI